MPDSDLGSSGGTAESLAEAEEALYQRFKARMLVEMKAEAQEAQRRYMDIRMKVPRKPTSPS